MIMHGFRTTSKVISNRCKSSFAPNSFTASPSTNPPLIPDEWRVNIRDVLTVGTGIVFFSWIGMKIWSTRNLSSKIDIIREDFQRSLQAHQSSLQVQAERSDKLYNALLEERKATSDSLTAQAKAASDAASAQAKETAAASAKADAKYYDLLEKVNKKWG